MKSAVLILLLTLFKPQRTLQLSAIEKARSRQDPDDVGEEASDQSVYFQNEQVLSDVKKAMSWQNPENTEEETGGQSLHFQEDRVLSETAVSRQNPDGKEVQGYDKDPPKKRPCGSLIEDVMEIYENLAVCDYQVNEDIKNCFQS